MNTYENVYEVTWDKKDYEVISEGKKHGTFVSKHLEVAKAKAWELIEDGYENVIVSKVSEFYLG